MMQIAPIGTNRGENAASMATNAAPIDARLERSFIIATWFDLLLFFWPGQPVLIVSFCTRIR
jgi:hypothetical protein